MAKITLAFPIEKMSGSISKNDQAFTLRYRNGRPFTYTYTRHAPWSDTQHATRALFGATTYFAYLILTINNAATTLEPLMHKAKTQPITPQTNATQTKSSTPKTYNRLSGFVASLLRPILLQDEDLRLQVLNAYTAYRTLKARNTPNTPNTSNTPKDIQLLKTSHLPLAQTLLSRLLPSSK